MEQFIVSARKYRPQTFRDVVGQEAITSTLVNAIESNHLAQALLFTGPRGVGKTTCARILARKINQEGYDDPNEDFAFNVFELDAASNNSVDDIRSLIDQVRIPPQTGKYKVYIIDEVHMLSSAAFNAFLKTLEEPPRHAIFILATTEKHKIIPTILSRCQIFDFKRITIADAANHLALVARSQGINYEDDALRIIAQKADGAMRDALSIFDRVVSYCGRNLTRQAVAENLNVLDFEYYIRITDFILQNNIPALLIAYNDILSKGFDGHHFVSGLASHFRDLMVCKTPETIGLLEIGDHGKQLFEVQSQRTSMPFLLQAIEIANDSDLKYKSSQNQRLLVELCLMQLASLSYEGEKKDKQFIIPASALRALLQNVMPNQVETLNQLANSSNHTISEVGSNELTDINTVSSDNIGSPINPDNAFNGQVNTFETQGVPQNQPIEVNPIGNIQEVSQNSNTLGNVESQQPKRTSALSLTSIRNRKELASSLEKNVVNPDDLPKESFTYNQLMEEWNFYTDRLLRSGLPLMASLMGMARPELKASKIELELPNAGSKLSFEENKYDLVNYLRKKLQNFDIELNIIVNEEIKLVKKVLDSKDKYQHFVDLNPEVNALRDMFDLEIR